MNFDPMSSFDRYDELERLLLRGEYMTTSEMKKFAKLWRRRQASWRFTATVVDVVRAPLAGGEATCGFFDRPRKDQ